jgi:hypothetical protein
MEIELARPAGVEGGQKGDAHKSKVTQGHKSRQGRKQVLLQRRLPLKK